MSRLAEIAVQEAQKGFNGKISGKEPNIHEIVELFPKWSVEQADALWCAAFVFHCCKKAGMQIPYKPAECSMSLAACYAWDEWAKRDDRIGYIPGNADPQTGDIVIFDKVFCDSPHDHMGIVVDVKDDSIVTAEGNYNNESRIVNRKKDNHVRCYIRIADNFIY